MIELKDIVNKVVLDWHEFYDMQNELEFLRKLVISFISKSITEEEFYEQLTEANKKWYYWR